MQRESRLRQDLPPIRLWRVFTDTLGAMRIHSRSIGRVIFWPLAINIALYFAVDMLLQHFFTPRLKLGLETGAYFFVHYMLYPYIALCVHRLMLLGGRASRWQFTKTWSYRTFQFLKKIFIINILVIIPIGIGVVVGLQLHERFASGETVYSTYFLAPLVTAVIISFYLFLRFCFVFPAIAVDAPYSLSDSWVVTKGVSFKIFLLGSIFLAPIITAIVVGTLILTPYIPPILTVDGNYSIQISYYLWMPLTTVLSYLQLVILVTLASICFYTRTNWHPGAVRMDNNHV